MIAGPMLHGWPPVLCSPPRLRFKAVSPCALGAPRSRRCGRPRAIGGGLVQAVYQRLERVVLHSGSARPAAAHSCGCGRLLACSLVSRTCTTTKMRVRIYNRERLAGPTGVLTCLGAAKKQISRHQNKSARLYARTLTLLGKAGLCARPFAGMLILHRALGGVRS